MDSAPVVGTQAQAGPPVAPTPPRRVTEGMDGNIGNNFHVKAPNGDTADGMTTIHAAERESGFFDIPLPRLNSSQPTISS